MSLHIGQTDLTNRKHTTPFLSQDLGSYPIFFHTNISLLSP